MGLEAHHGTDYQARPLTLYALYASIELSMTTFWQLTMRLHGTLNTLLLASGLALTSGAWAGVKLDGTVFEKVGKAEAVDPLLLYSVAITESALASGGGRIAPHPYVIRSDLTGPQFFDTYADAESALKALMKKTTNIDIGMMQVNLRHHPQKNPSALLTPEFAVRYAARYLKTTMASTTDPIIGVGRYHSYTEDLANWYGARVWTIYNNIRRLGE